MELVPPNRNVQQGFQTKKELIEAAQDFEDELNTEPLTVADGLVVIEELDPEFEKLLAS